MLSDQSLRTELDQTGYFPRIVADALDIALGGETPTAFFVLPDVAFGIGTIGRHLTVLVMTATRLISAHVDDHAGDELAPAAVAATTEAVPLGRIESVTLSQITSEPTDYLSGDSPGLVRLAINWGGSQMLEFEPATCGDPECAAEHGFSGSLNGEDISLQVSKEVSGEEGAAKLIAFARQLYAATASAA